MRRTNSKKGHFGHLAMAFRTAALLTILFTGLHLCTAAAQDVQCGDMVQFNNARIEVQPAGADDTANIQCALDEATRLGLPLVKLLAGDFLIGYIRGVGFEGTLEGSGADSTNVAVDDTLLDCAAQLDAGYALSAALRFVSGDVTVARMTLGANNPCVDEGVLGNFTLVHFTGATAAEGCGSNTVHGMLDRATLVSTVSASDQPQFVAGVAATSVPDCEQPVLGTLKVNRSMFGGLTFAVRPELRGSGQVDINFNDFVNNYTDVASDNSGQLMTVQSNSLLKTDEGDFNHIAISVTSTLADAPRQTRLVVYRNKFEIAQASDLNLLAFAVGAVSVPPAQTSISLAVTENEFSITGGDLTVLSGVFLNGVSGANIANNTFSGAGGYTVGGLPVAIIGNDTSVTGNDFSGFLSLPYNVQITEESTGNIVGPGQGAVVLDQGTGNYVLGAPQASSKSAGVPTPLLRSAASDLQARFEQAQERVARVLEAGAR